MSFDKELARRTRGNCSTRAMPELPIPYEKGNSIRVKNIVIRKHSERLSYL